MSCFFVFWLSISTTTIIITNNNNNNESLNYIFFWKKNRTEYIYSVDVFSRTYTHISHIYIELAALCDDDDDILRMCDQRIQNERNKQIKKKSWQRIFSSIFLSHCVCMCMCSIIFVVIIIIIIDFGHMMIWEKKLLFFFSYKTIYYVCM